MSKPSINKTINLLFRVAIGVLAIYFIYVKIKTQIVAQSNYVFFEDVNYLLLSIAFLLFVVNWGIESYKWKYLVSSSIKITFIKSFKIIITSITVGLITPNRIGEIPARAILVNEKKRFKDLLTFTFIGAFAQGLTTLIFGVLSLFIALNYFTQFIFMPIYLSVAVVILVVFIVLYFKPIIFKNLGNKISFINKKILFDSFQLLSFNILLKTLLISMLRYFVFALQYYLILTAFGIQFTAIQDLALIAICFAITSLIPTLLISEIGVRGSVALFVFGFISNHAIAIATASIMLWLINVAFPAIIGLLGLKQFKILSTK